MDSVFNITLEHYIILCSLEFLVPYFACIVREYRSHPNYRKFILIYTN